MLVPVQLPWKLKMAYLVEDGSGIDIVKIVKKR
jgi:hypothetical protein